MTAGFCRLDTGIDSNLVAALQRSLLLYKKVVCLAEQAEGTQRIMKRVKRRYALI